MPFLHGGKLNTRRFKLDAKKSKIKAASPDFFTYSRWMFSCDVKDQPTLFPLSIKDAMQPKYNTPSGQSRDNLSFKMLSRTRFDSFHLAINSIVLIVYLLLVDGQSGSSAIHNKTMVLFSGFSHELHPWEPLLDLHSNRN